MAVDSMQRCTYPPHKQYYQCACEQKRMSSNRLSLSHWERYVPHRNMYDKGFPSSSTIMIKTSDEQISNVISRPDRWETPKKRVTLKGNSRRQFSHLHTSRAWPDPEVVYRKGAEPVDNSLGPPRPLTSLDSSLSQQGACCPSLEYTSNLRRCFDVMAFTVHDRFR
ncbi:hypothetical protein TWF696_001894 [Orbilia brochopaga]|uniref:Uncharacterized protein n=1 Tax=Orbilia brochopaga TaxID=3140254 RepID=A0AAV9U8U0_9PEZI